MLTRQQKFRRIRHNNRIRPIPRMPLSLFVEGGELTKEVKLPLFKSFSESLGIPHAANTQHQELPVIVPPKSLQRSISEEYVTETRSLFSKYRQTASSPSLGKRGKGVAFTSRIEVHLIPTAKELSHEVIADIWWSKSELQSFQRALLGAIPPDCNLKQSILSLGGIVTRNEFEKELLGTSDIPFAHCEPINHLLISTPERNVVY